MLRNELWRGEEVEEHIVGCWIDQCGSVNDNLKILLSLIWGKEENNKMYKNRNAKELL